MVISRRSTATIPLGCSPNVGARTEDSYLSSLGFAGRKYRRQNESTVSSRKPSTLSIRYPFPDSPQMRYDVHHTPAGGY